MVNRRLANKIIKDTVRSSIVDFAKKSLRKRASFQILDLIIPKERKIRSIVGGLETSLGTTLWEPLAKALAKENGFEVIASDLSCPTNMPSNLANTLQSIIEDRKHNTGLYTAETSHQEIKRIFQSFLNRPIDKFEKAPRGKGVDIWIKKKNINYFFDTKTVQPNLGTLTGCMEQILTWYAYFYSQYPQGNAVARIVFPYNPTPELSFWDGVIGKGKPLEPVQEAWVENEFWDFCSGLTDTYTLITQAFSELKESGELEDALNSLLHN